MGLRGGLDWTGLDWTRSGCQRRGCLVGLVDLGGCFWGASGVVWSLVRKKENGVWVAEQKKEAIWAEGEESEERWKEKMEGDRGEV